MHAPVSAAHREEMRAFFARGVAGVPEHRERAGRMRAQLIAWCEENGDHAMARDGKLAFEETFPAKDPPRQNAFGRRHW